MRAQAELVEERSRIERNDRPDDDWLMRTADIVAEGEQGRCPRLQRPTESGNGGRAAQALVRSVASASEIAVLAVLALLLSSIPMGWRAMARAKLERVGMRRP